MIPYYKKDFQIYKFLTSNEKKGILNVSDEDFKNETIYKIFHNSNINSNKNLNKNSWESVVYCDVI